MSKMKGKLSLLLAFTGQFFATWLFVAWMSVLLMAMFHDHEKSLENHYIKV